MNALKGLLMHSKCHIATAPVSQKDYPVPVSNVLYSVCLLWDVVVVFVCESWKTERADIMWNQGAVISPYGKLSAAVTECFEGGAEIMN